MRIPELILITPELPAAEILRRAGAALEGTRLPEGRVAVQLRAWHLDAAERHALGEALRALTRTHGVALLVNGDLELASALEADGVQLPERGPSVERARARLAPGTLIGASRHDAAGVTAAAREGASFALLSPVYDVPGKGPALGLEAFARIAKHSPIPVIALGGVQREHVAGLLAAGAVGIAVIRPAFDADDPGRATRALLDALAAASSVASA